MYVCMHVYIHTHLIFMVVILLLHMHACMYVCTHSPHLHGRHPAAAQILHIELLYLPAHPLVVGMRPVCMYMCVYVCMSVCSHVYMCVHVCMCVYIYIRKGCLILSFCICQLILQSQVCVLYVCICVCINACLYVFMYVCV
jgi:hypothetical protein